ncbi:uncharacterized protein [Periplaneta americana]|uniref:uncharacterized protein n=1 Tax=Periplaneta americana TaxID=6978 RepID=UPI0037E89EFA
MNEPISNIKFVREVEKHPILYNYNLPEYSRKALTEKAWGEVGKEVHLPASDCKERWRNLRAVFVRKMKPSPNGSGSTRKRPYYLAQAMQFAVPYIKSLATTAPRNLPGASLRKQHEVFDDIEIIIDNTCHRVTASLPPIPPPPRPPKPPAVPANSAKLAAIPGQNCRQTERNEATKMFLLSLLPELEEMTDQQLKVFKRRTLLMIDDITGQTSSVPSDPVFSPASVHSSS